MNFGFIRVLMAVALGIQQGKATGNWPRNPAWYPSNPGMDEIERAAIRNTGYDPDDPAVVAAIDQVRAELAAVGTRPGNYVGTGRKPVK